jgi:PAS domain S-box-containing protein
LPNDTGILVVSEAVTDQGTQELERYKQLYETLPVAIGINTIGEHGQFDFVNQAAVDLFDADSKEELKAHSPGELYADSSERTQFSEQITQNGAVEEYETVFLTLDDEAFWGSITAELAEIDGEKRIVGTLKDITDRREKQRALQEERAFIDGIVDSLPDIFYAFDTEGSLVEYNDQLATVTEYDQQELESMAPWEFVPGSEQEMVIDAVNRLVESEEQIDNLEAHLMTKTGDEIPYEFSISPLSDGNGTVIGFTGVGRDISERQERERELKRKTRAMEKAPIGISLSDPQQEDNPLIYVNERYEEMTGYTSEEATGENCRFLQGEETAAQPVAEMREAIDDRRPVTTELRNYRKDGSEFWNRISIAPVRDNDGNLLNFVGFQQDITEQKESERKLQRQNERLEKFTSVISHDLRNPIGIAEGYVDLAEERGNPEDFQTIRKSLSRMDTMIEELLTMASADTIIEDREPIELVVLVHEAWQTAQTEGATLEVAVDSKVSITGDRDILLNVFENLFRNAVDHNEPPLTVRVGALDEAQEGFYIEDDGDGIPEEEREVVFDHGHTTSADGTGLGLYIVNELVMAHSWTITVTEGTDGGARFEVLTQTDSI